MHPAAVIVALLCASLSAIAAHALPTFPELTGRVVDNAGLLDTSREHRISQLLEAHENATTNQIVVVTLPNLGGHSIETYGYQLARDWGVGQKGQDNGVLLIVAKKERKVRIEVGYGLEGTLTDAIAANIVHTVILPLFKRGDFDEGIERGANTIIQALGGQYTMKPERGRGATSDTDHFPLPFILLLLVGGVIVIFSIYQSERLSRGGYSSSWGGGFRGGGFSGGWGGSSGGGGGFSGGGGSFGGGGASGGW